MDYFFPVTLLAFLNWLDRLFLVILPWSFPNNLPNVASTESWNRDRKITFWCEMHNYRHQNSTQEVAGMRYTLCSNTQGFWPYRNWWFIKGSISNRRTVPTIYAKVLKLFPFHSLIALPFSSSESSGYPRKLIFWTLFAVGCKVLCGVQHCS